MRAYARLAAEGYLELRQGATATVRRVPQSAPRPGVKGRVEQRSRIIFDLRPHQPDLSAFPRHVWLRSLRRALATAADADFGYVDPCGLQQLRTEMSMYLRRARGVAADPNRLVITTGSTNSLSLISRALAGAGARTIAFENPSHRLLYRVARVAGLTPLGIPVDDSGLQVDRLCASTTGAVVVTPAHQFPTGVVLSADRRAALVRWARETGGLIIEDDFDAEFRYDRPPIGALQGLAPEQVVYIGSTGKTLSPGIRLGWVVLPAELVANVAEELETSILLVSGIDQLAMADFVRHGEFDRHLRRMRTLYRRRRDQLVGALRARLPKPRISGIAAGLHVVVELPSRDAEVEACERAKTRGLAIHSISDHALPGYAGPSGLLLGYGRIAEPTIPLAVDQLAHVLRAGRRSAAARVRNGR